MTSIPPTQTWNCDSCRQPIAGHEGGWVEWQTFQQAEDGNPSRGIGIRIVHRHGLGRDGTCQYNSHRRDGFMVSDGALSEFVGPDGLMDLLELIQKEELPASEVIELIKRIHVPGYEASRPHLNEAIRNGIIEINREDGFYSQDQLMSVLEWASRDPG
ncbi:MAG: hypothetical protein WBC44_21550 [Planctomycetaceae bacterium]